KNVKVPDDVSIISFNNVLIAEMAHPALTSVDIQVFKLGYYAGDCLIEKIKNPDEPHKRVIVPFKLVERESCKRSEERRVGKESRCKRWQKTAYEIET